MGTQVPGKSLGQCAHGERVLILHMRTPIRSFCGGGGGWDGAWLDLGAGVTTEIQAGGGVLHCKSYASGMAGHEKEPPRENAIRIAAQIISVAGADDGRCVRTACVL